MNTFTQSIRSDNPSITTEAISCSSHLGSDEFQLEAAIQQIRYWQRKEIDLDLCAPLIGPWLMRDTSCTVVWALMDHAHTATLWDHPACQNECRHAMQLWWLNTRRGSVRYQPKMLVKARAISYGWIGQDGSFKDFYKERLFKTTLEHEDAGYHVFLRGMSRWCEMAQSMAAHILFESKSELLISHGIKILKAMGKPCYGIYDRWIASLHYEADTKEASERILIESAWPWLIEYRHYVEHVYGQIVLTQDMKLMIKDWLQHHGQDLVAFKLPELDYDLNACMGSIQPDSIC